MKPALHGRARKAAIEPGRDALEAVEPDEFARAVKADQIAYPAEHRNIGDREVVIHEPLPSSEVLLHHCKQTPGFVDIALKRPFVGHLLASEFVAVAALSNHRSDPTHLEVHPLDGSIS